MIQQFEEVESFFRVEVHFQNFLISEHLKSCIPGGHIGFDSDSFTPQKESADDERGADDCVIRWCGEEDCKHCTE